MLHALRLGEAVNLVGYGIAIVGALDQETMQLGESLARREAGTFASANANRSRTVTGDV